MKTPLFALTLFVSAAAALEAAPYLIEDILTAESPSASRSKDWKPSAGIALEVSGMDWMPDDSLAVATRKGDVWKVTGALDPAPDKSRFSLFASGLHEPLGLLRDGDALLVTQRTEVTRLRDTDGDGIADEYINVGRGWNVSGAYHGYAYGPRRDGQGRLWVSLNLDMGDRVDNKAPWRGWAGTLSENGTFIPQAAGMRSPCGLGANTEGDMFCVDQQGTWVPATPVYHLRRGAFFLNPEGIASQVLPASPLHLSVKLPEKVPYPDAVRALPEMRPPAVWLPYNKMGRSGTDLAVCEAGGKFGPFDGQLLVAEFTDAKVNRVFLEKVDGEYQGAAFPFLKGFASGIVRLLFAKDGTLLVGMTSRGWSSLGTKAYGLQRVRWTGETPFSLREMRALPDGFELSFNEAVNPATALDTASYSMKSYTYFYSSAYGSDEIDMQEPRIIQAKLGNDPRTVRITVEGLRPLYIHELHAAGVKSVRGSHLEHADAYYTLNRIPHSPSPPKPPAPEPAR